MEVIKKGTTNPNVMEVTCHHCDAVLEIDIHDLTACGNKKPPVVVKYICSNCKRPNCIDTDHLTTYLYSDLLKCFK